MANQTGRRASDGNARVLLHIDLDMRVCGDGPASPTSSLLKEVGLTSMNKLTS